MTPLERRLAAQYRENRRRFGALRASRGADAGGTACRECARSGATLEESARLHLELERAAPARPARAAETREEAIGRLVSAGYSYKTAAYAADANAAWGEIAR